MSRSIPIAGLILGFIVSSAVFCGSTLAAAPAARTAAAPAEAKKVDLDQLLNDVRQSHGAERKHNQERETRFLQAKTQQQTLLAQARAQEQQEERKSDTLRRQFEQNETRLAALEQELAGRAGELKDVFSIARQAALEARGSIKNSVVNVQFGGWAETLADIAARPHALSIDDLEHLWLTMLEATAQNGKVTRFQAPVITARGEEMQKTVTRVGVFNAVSDGVFLRYLPETAQLVELNRQPPARFTSLVSDLENSGEGFQTFPVDPSRGAILSLIVHTPDMIETIEAGGLIGYIIMAIGIIGIGIAGYRYVALVATRRKIDVQEKVEAYNDDNPLGRLHKVAEQASNLSAKSLSARLHEKIGEEASIMHSGLRTLGLFAAIAPLLGLLGTVTGMILTFQSITLFGSGDPRIMSSGISQALVTTVQGLVVAIPILLIHSFLNGQANRLVEVLEHHSTRLMVASGKEH